MGRRDVISGIFILAISSVTCVMAYRLEIGTWSNPGSGFAAFGIALLLGFMSIYLILRGFSQTLKREREKETLLPIPWGKPLIILIILLGYGVSFNLLGFPVDTFLLMMVLVWLFGRQRFKLALLFSMITVVSSYILFVVVLGLPLPSGKLWFIFW